MKQVFAASPDALKQRLIEAMRLHTQGHREAAQAAYAALLEDYPGQPDILHALGTLHLQAGEWKEAAACFQKALAAKPRQIRHLLPLARALIKQGQSEPAMDALAEILALDPNHAEARDMLYDLCLPETRSNGLTRSPINRLIAANPRALGLRSVAIRLCRLLDEREERLKHLEEIYRQNACGEDYFPEYAAMLGSSGQYDRSARVCDEALAVYPNLVDMHRVRANMYLLKKQYADALASYRRVLALKPGDIHSRMLIGIITLLTSDCKEGFEDFAALRDRMYYQAKLNMPIAEWCGEPLSGKRLLIWCNEGIGDVVMYAGLLPWLLPQGAQLTLAMYPKLIPLFARSFPGLTLIPYTPDKPGTAQQLFDEYKNKCDFQLAFTQLMSRALPHYTPSEHPPFLKADTVRADVLRKKYLALKPPGEIKKVVGIAWFTAHKDDAHMRNISLDRWRPLFELPHVQYVSLQYGDHAAEIDAINRKFPGKLYADPTVDAFDDIEALAAQIMAMDEVVSIDNATVHLAGALGVKTTLLLSAASEWRWGLERTDSRWYASLHIERQKKLLDWKSLMARVRDRLSAV